MPPKRKTCKEVLETKVESADLVNNPQLVTRLCQIRSDVGITRKAMTEKLTRKQAKDLIDRVLDLIDRKDATNADVYRHVAYVIGRYPRPSEMAAFYLTILGGKTTFQRADVPIWSNDGDDLWIPGEVPNRPGRTRFARAVLDMFGDLKRITTENNVDYMWIKKGNVPHSVTIRIYALNSRGAAACIKKAYNAVKALAENKKLGCQYAVPSIVTYETVKRNDGSDGIKKTVRKERLPNPLPIRDPKRLQP